MLYANSVTYSDFKAGKIGSRKKTKVLTEEQYEHAYNVLKEHCKELIKCGGVRQVNYSLSQCGRMFAVGSSVQGMESQIRSRFCRDTCTDLDMVNAGATIIRYLCKQYDVLAPNIAFYCDRRDDVIAMFSSRQEAKDTFITQLFG